MAVEILRNHGTEVIQSIPGSTICLDPSGDPLSEYRETGYYDKEEEMRRLRTTAATVVAVGVIVMALAACNDDSSDSADAQAGVQAETQKAQMMAALIQYRLEDIHNLDDSVQRASGIEPAWKGKVTRMRQVTAAVDWPEEFADNTATFESELGLEEEALDAEDLKAVKEHSALAHQAWHGIDGRAYAYIAGEGDGQGEDHEMSASPPSSH